MKLDATVITELKQPILATWNYIGSDAMEFVQSNAEAMEMVLDAGRLTTCGNSPRAQELIDVLFKEHGYSKVSKFICKNIRLL